MVLLHACCYQSYGCMLAAWLVTLQCNARGLARRRCSSCKPGLLPLPGCEVQSMQIIQAGPSSVPSKDYHLTPHEDG